MLIELALIGITIYILWLALRKPSNYPPGPWGVPLFGYLPLSIPGAEKMLKELHRKHGPIVSWRIGARFLVFIFDYKLIKETLMSPHFADRPETQLLSLLQGGNNLGLIGSSGPHWNAIRRFSLRHLKDLGMGKSTLTTAIQFEAIELTNNLKSLAGKPTHIPHSVTIAVLNVIWQMMASKRYQLDDEEIGEFERIIKDLQNNAGGFVLLEVFPWIKYGLPEFILNKIARKEELDYISGRLREFFKGHVDDHIKMFGENEDDPRDYIDAYLIEMKKQQSDPDSTMSIEDLIYCLADLFTAGSETTTTTLHWIMFFLAGFPDVQKRLQAEIDSVLPKGALATLSHKSQLPYTEAFIHEALRYSTITPTGVMHTSSIDSSIGGYLIPKGSLVFSSILTAHFSSEFFESPDEFRPDRFLDSDGKFVNPKEGFMPFSIGRRQCLGESLARMELLIFVTTLIQNLHFEAPAGKTIDLEPVPNPFIHFPLNQELLMTIR